MAAYTTATSITVVDTDRVGKNKVEFGTFVPPAEATMYVEVKTLQKVKHVNVMPPAVNATPRYVIRVVPRVYGSDLAVDVHNKRFVVEMSGAVAVTDTPFTYEAIGD